MSAARNSRKPAAQTTTRVVTTTGGSVHITQPSARKNRQPKPKVTVLVGNTDNLVRGHVGGFIAFLREHAVVGLAVGFVIGQQAQILIKQLIASFIDPLSALLFNGTKLSASTVTLHFRGQSEAFGWGAFVYALIDFIFVLAAIYLVIRIFQLDRLDKPKPK